MIKIERKSLIPLVIALLISLVLAACGGADPAPTSTPVPPAAIAVPAPAIDTAVPATATSEPATPTSAPPAVTPEPPAAGNPESGKQVAQTVGCAGCHSVDGTKIVGPSWKGLFGKTETFADGSTAVVDEAYIRESILTPSAKVVADFPDNVMPKTFGEQLSEEQIADLIAYIMSLK